MDVKELDIHNIHIINMILCTQFKQINEMIKMIVKFVINVNEIS